MNMPSTRSVVSTLALLCVPYAASASSHDAVFHFDGLWRITTVTGYSDITISPAAIRELLGQTVAIGPGRVRVADIDCVPDTIRVDMRATPPLLTGAYHANQSEVGIPRRTLVLDAGLCGLVFRAGSGIIVTEGGAFYRATRIMSGLRER